MGVTGKEAAALAEALMPIGISHELGNECRSLSVDCGGYRVSLGYAITPERRKVAPDDATRGDKFLREQIEACCAQIRAGDGVAIAKMIADGTCWVLGDAGNPGGATADAAYLAEQAQQREAAMARAIYGSSQRAGHVVHSMTEHLWDCGTQFECECGWLSPFAPSKPAIQADMRSKGLDPDGPLVPLPAPQEPDERVFAAPAHDYLAALHRPYVPPV